MINFQRKRGWRDIMQSKPVLVFLGILILIFTWNILGFLSKMQETEKNKKIAEERVALLHQKKEDISSEINSLNTVQGKEEFIRENYGWAKEGEDVIVVVEGKNPSEVPKTSSSLGFFSFLFFWKNWFK